jgi:hypothetical protein
LVFCWATAFNSKVAMKAQAEILAKAASDAAVSADAVALDFTQAEVAAAAAKERLGNKGDDTMSGEDLAAAEKFAHLKKSVKGWGKYGAKGKRVQFLEALSPAWTELVVCDAPAATLVNAAAAAEPTWPGASGGSGPPPCWPRSRRRARLLLGSDPRRAPRSAGCSNRRHGRRRELKAMEAYFV